MTALVVLTNKALQSGAFELADDTCLNQVARLAQFLTADTEISMFFGHTDAKWKGRGLR